MPEDRFLTDTAADTTSRLVLVVDDEPLMRLLANESLAASGLQVVEAEDGRAAIEACRRHRPGIVLMDVQMPEMDGFEACRQLRASPFGRHTPILMMTGLDDLESIRQAYDAGATDFVSKPINWLVLGQRVEYMLRAGRNAEALRRSEARLADAQRLARLGYWELAADTGQLCCSPELARLLGVPVAAMPPSLEKMLECVHRRDLEAVEQSIRSCLRGETPEGVEYRLCVAGSSERWLRHELEARRDEDGRIAGIAAAVQNVTQRRAAAERIRMLSYFDELTGLPNRRSFVERFEQASHSARRYGRTMAVLALDLDRLRRINETLGHPAGDVVLRETAERLLRTLRASDILGRPAAGGAPPARMDFVARLGGDEFVVLLTEIGRAEDAAAVAGRIGQILAEPFEYATGKVFLGASIGIAVYPHDGLDADSLIQRSTTARNHAKEHGGDCYRYFDPSMNAAALERLDLEGALRTALERQQLELWYQPQYRLDTGTLVGAEALLRWRSPQRGLVSPLTIIPIAEETGLIEPLGEWCLRQACTQASEWSRRYPRPLRIAVNVSGKQFESGALIETVTRALGDSGLDPRLLELELTENVLMRDLEGAVDTLAALRSLGAGLAIDDFGVGYSSLNYLMRFGVDRLKIDRSFVKRLPDHAESRGIVKAMISMARSMGLEVLGEGVETEEQLELLRRTGCDLIQGFLYGRPMPADEFARLLDDDRPAVARPIAAVG